MQTDSNSIHHLAVLYAVSIISKKDRTQQIKARRKSGVQNNYTENKNGGIDGYQQKCTMHRGSTADHTQRQNKSKNKGKQKHDFSFFYTNHKNVCQKKEHYIDEEKRKIFRIYHMKFLLHIYLKHNTTNSHKSKQKKSFKLYVIEKYTDFHLRMTQIRKTEDKNQRPCSYCFCPNIIHTKKSELLATGCGAFHFSLYFDTVNIFYVRVIGALLSIGLLADIAGIRPFAGMDPHMYIEVVSHREAFAAHFA